MPTEIEVLAYAGLWQVVQFVIMAIAANLQLGVAYTAGPRDEPRSMSGVPGRLVRAFDNHVQALVLFTLAVVVVTLGGRADDFTAGCAWIYLAARVVYVPAYASGVFMLRSAVWAVGFFASVAMLVHAVM